MFDSQMNLKHCVPTEISEKAVKNTMGATRLGIAFIKHCETTPVRTWSRCDFRAFAEVKA